METYSYKALKDDKLVSGELEGRDENEIAGKLQEQGLEVLNIKQEGGKKSVTPSIGKVKTSFLDRFKKVKKVEKMFLYKNFATMLKAGLPLPEAIDLMRESLKNPLLEGVLSQLKYDVEAGNYISASLSKFSDIFSQSEISMIQAGEAGGTLPQSFHGLFIDAEAETKLQKDIKGAMMYPAIILSILLLVTLLLLIFVLPQLTGFFLQANIEVPTMTRIIMAASDFFKDYFFLIAIVVVALIVTLRSLIKKSKTVKKYFDKFTIRIPWLGMQFKYYYIHKIARMLGLLIKSGVPILEALEIVEKSIGHLGFSNSIRVMRSDIKRGGKLSTSVQSFDKLYPPFVSRMLSVGDRTGNTSEALENVSEYYDEELRSTLANISSIIEPILMVALGLGVAFIAISVLIPMYSIVSGINQMQK
ncbi:type II secretion system F family protein [Candidatus Dojkabacteria bacterium]|nr:type II secretion system F family protein [Candidatus Dojkabacteria bacterium]